MMGRPTRQGSAGFARVSGVSRAHVEPPGGGLPKMLWHIRISLAGDVKWTRKLALKVYLQSALSPDLDLRPTTIPRLTC